MLFSCFGIKGQAPAGGTRRSPRRQPAGRRRGARTHREEREGPRAAKLKRKVVVVGDGECGKTCLLQRFCRDVYHVQGYLPTVFDTEVVDVELPDKTTVELMITDTAGQEDYDRLRPYSYPDADVVIVCFAVDNPDSLENVRLTWIPEVRNFCGDVPVLLVGNKLDLRDQGEAEMGLSTASSQDFQDFRECCPSATLIKQGPVKLSSAKKLAAEVGAVGYWETSALLDQGVAEVFQAASSAAVRCPAQSQRKASCRGRCRRRKSLLERIGMERSRLG